MGYLLSLLILSAFYFFANPYWYGDAPWYALDISSNGPIKMDAFHLVWRPLARSLWLELLGNFPNFDPLLSFRMLSSLGAALTVVSVYALSKRFGLSKREACGAALLMAGSHFLLAYGGSGASYPACTAFAVLAFIPLAVSNSREWSVKQGIYSALLFTISWFMWGVTVLLIPALFIAAYLYSHGPFGRRFFRATYLCVFAGALIAGSLFGTYAALVKPFYPLSFSAWFFEAKTHAPGGSLSILNLARSVLGYVASFAYLGTLGTSIKGILLGGISGSKLLPHIVPILFLGFIGAISLVSLYMLAFNAGRVRSNTFEAGNILAISLFALIPSAIFAVFWAGSDVERYCLPLAFVSIAIVAGLRLCSVSALLPGAAVLLVNISTLTIPSLMSKGGLVMALGEISAKHLPPNSLLVVTGQTLGPPVWVPTQYFHHIKVFSVSFDVDMRGAEGWDERLLSDIAVAQISKGRVAVLSDFFGEPTPGGIALNEQEMPVPKMSEVKDLFSAWKKTSDFTVDRFHFYVLEE